MRILISTNYKGSWPYIPEMVEAFNNKGIVCDVYDTSECKLIFNNLQSEKYIINKIIYKFIIKIPKIKNYFTKKINKKFYCKYKMQYDIHTLHYVQLFYFDFIDIIKTFSNKTVCVTWGSDIFRLNDVDCDKLKFIINNTDYLIATKPMVEFLSNKFEITSKIKMNNLYVVSKSIDNLAKLINDETMVYSKEQLDIPLDTIVITFGYNASVLQQHDFFLKTLKNIQPQLLENILFLLPMTYREDRFCYIKEIDNKLKDLNVNYKIFDSFLNEKDVLRIRRVSDITINLQKTDALSSSIREHLYANNLLIVGDWLPYQVFEEMGIYYLKTNINNFEITLIDCLKQYDKYFKNCKNNSDIIYSNFSFEKNIDKWIVFYESILNN